MSTNAKMAEKTPCVDLGSLFKWWLNPSKIFRTPNRKMKNTTPVVVVGSGSHSGDGTTEFVKAATKKLLYFSYRNCFPPLPNGSTTDTRWGCLVRTTQMLVGTCLLRYHCQGAYVLPEADNAELKERISRLFMDVPSAPLGIHKAEDEAHKNSVKYASMLSPTEAGMAIAAALIAFHAQGGDVPFTFCCESRNIDEPAVMAKLSEGQHVILIIPVVLGIAPMSDQYERMMLKILDMKACCGIAGGLKRASLYMFGHQGRSVFFMDPHYIQNAYTSDRTVGTLEGARGELSARRFDPCMVLGFYLHTLEDYRVFAEELAVANSLVAFPLISFGQRPREGTTPSDNGVVSVAESEEGIMPHENEKSQLSPNPLAAGGGHARSSNPISPLPS
ncbi:ATG4.1 / AUT2/APG4/ATG4 cysteine peptidase [Leishmania donovani]|uniref:Cysteine protease n=1 Tax=Leishmania donovani TaxID=5661 RepID=A0A504XGE6_LEIDO|nr:AUT2/APG4/ATG4 cysteine peptidase, putative [Leishmania donovani]TPP43901.1 Peptidase C54 family protein [Leishmania donovani]TPP47404.1 Peptidase C54 family protein [Leishmania donovani]CAJ1991947.1 ATG4.1 / AUT2/APG4/ATG4 cysteine peptidase [Leishmania donovani]CBZ37132.1 AUT2/APG4/ATG4 cysteine peptidase, putative [Leishmania donovani]VDZ47784.1 AUT2/APG4/ATG4_cysteine_peptidase_putative/GeneDB:LmjF.32.3890 [Leishmania donovani]